MRLLSRWLLVTQKPHQDEMQSSPHNHRPTPKKVFDILEAIAS
jgi:hypothetical protein